ncbi:hypothetical protein DSO57_1000260 [Entomophthora muscae]|uniref:Uncharacterized protein n=1 Tax=Entomophthora muscae TaxID=34485 RepID=A0ACC2SYH2_9FUNG|nr:hypothetical protein DSO57_1000260 [Entomophthora muscae]
MDGLEHSFDHKSTAGDFLNVDSKFEDSPSLHSAHCNSIIKFGFCHHEETMYSFVQALHSHEDAMTPIHAGKFYHSWYEESHLASECV